MKKSIFSKLFSGHILIAGILALAAALSNPANAAAQSGTFDVTNDSSYRINNLYVSRSSSDVWGRDRLGSAVLLPGYHTVLTLAPGLYDVKLVDEDRDVCVVSDVYLGASENWTITDAALLLCEGM
jgi:hypothetical protein